MPLQEIDYSASGDTRLDADIKINDAITALNELSGGTAGQIIKKSSSTDFDFAYTNSVLPDTGVASLKIKVMPIGDWNMAFNLSVSVTHGISNYKKIRSIDVIIRDDADSVYHKLDEFDQVSFAVQGGVFRVDATIIILAKLVGGTFDSASFDSTSYNRGWVTITYEV